MDLAGRWIQARLDEVCPLITDGTHHSPPNSEIGEYMYVTAKNIKPWGLDIRDITFVDAEHHREIYARCSVKSGDVLYIKDGVTAGLAAVNRLETPFSMLSSVALLRPNTEVLDAEFLKHWLNSPETFSVMTGGMTGSAIRRIILKQIRAAQLSLPPLNEQRRIAAKLDTTLAAVDACRQRLDGVAAILKRFRQAVLAAATSGELMREWREENQIEEEWCSGALGDLLRDKPRNGYSPKPADRETSVKSLTLSATTSGRFLEHHFKYIGEDIDPESHLWIRPGDILIQRANTLEYVGVSALYEGRHGEFIYPDLMMKCQASERVIPRFLHYLLLTERSRTFFRANATGTSGNMPKINQQIVLSLPVCWPSLREQQEIVRRGQALFTLADQLEARLTAARKVVDRLTPALLAKAFRGELVPQDPGDEPASVLLERIRAARQAEAGAGKSSRRGRPRAAANPAPINRHAAPVPSEPLPPDLLTQLLRECGALSERALLAVSELEPERFEQQLFRELEKGTAREVQANGQVLLEAVA